MPRLHLDYETFSECDLRAHGTELYVRHPSTEVLMAAYAFGGDPVQHWDATTEPMPQDLREAFEDPGVIIWAWNVPFEFGITKHVLGFDIPIERWRDTMVMALYNSLPGKLEQAAKVVRTPLPKMSEGKRLIRKFCTPRKPTKHNKAVRVYPNDAPDEWETFIDYNIRDVEVERDIYQKLRATAPPPSEWKLWFLDHKINQFGYPINLDAVRKVNDLANQERELLMTDLKGITGLKNPNSVKQLAPWLQDRGYPYESLDKEHTAKALASNDLTPDAREALELRSEASKSSVKKYPKIILTTDSTDWRLRGALRFYGAHTGRWTGAGAQVQNLPRPEKWIEESTWEYASQIVQMGSPHELRRLVDQPMDVFASVIRTMIQAPEGKDFAVADLASIETRVLGWIAECSGILAVYAADKDAYKEFATMMFHKPYEEVSKHERNLAKPPVLGCFAASTRILTRRGWVPIVSVREDDLLWDGTEWVSHDGVLYQGKKEVVDFNGVQATPDHLILMEDETWTPVSEIVEPKIIGKEPTYDVLNCGPRNRYTILTDKGPVIAHNCGYMLGTKGLKNYAAAMGVDMTEEEADYAKTVYRESYWEVVEHWGQLDRAFRRVIETGKSVEVGRLLFDEKGPFVRIRLPSGRHLYYLRPRIETVKAPWSTPERPATIDAITYESSVSEAGAGGWGRVATHCGKIEENVVQGIARDILAHGMILTDREGLPIFGHVHDEVKVVVDEDWTDALDTLIDCMTDVPAWADGLPLAAEGYRGKFYQK